MTVFKVRPGADLRVGSDRTSNTGAYVLPAARRPGTYYAQVARRGLANALCLPAKSANLRLI